MNRNAEFERMKDEYLRTEAPAEGMERMRRAMDRARMDGMRARRGRAMKRWGAAAAAVLMLAILPNTNARIAYAMGNLPVVGGLFRVITVRTYSHEDAHNEARVEVPQIAGGEGEAPAAEGAAGEVNRRVEAYTQTLIRAFEADMLADGHRLLEVTHETVTDTDGWFALKVMGLEVQASGYAFNRFYNIDKTTGSVVTLKDLFLEGADYAAPISEEIVRQMRGQMERGEADYFIDGDEGVVDGFRQIAGDQSFYLDAAGSLVIAFDEYEVGPGAIGAPQFVIPAEVIRPIVRPQYASAQP